MDRINILLLEDNPGDVYLVQEQLRDLKNFDFCLTEAQCLNEALQILATESFEAILIDLMLSDSQGIDTFIAVNKLAPDTAIVVISGSTDENSAVEAVRQGAQDYLVKGEMVPKSLAKTIQYAIERKSIYQQLQQRTAELEYFNQELQTFSYAVSHDLKNPLNFIMGMSSLLLNEKRSPPLEGRNREIIQRIHKSSARMAQITQNLLDLAQVQNYSMSIQEVNLSKLALEVVEELQSQQPERKVKFIVAPDIAAKADPQLIKLALENMLGNAWKYTYNNPQPAIEFGVEVDKTAAEDDLDSATDASADISDSFVYFIKDNGIGFDPAIAQELFTPFQRLDNSRDFFEGTGIGLATVKRIIDRHQGKIWFEAEPQQGASFMFSLGKREEGHKSI